MQEFKQNVKLYVDLKQEIAEENKHIREKRKRATAMEKDLMKTMQEAKIKTVNVRKGRFVLKLQERETVAPLKPDFIIQQLKDQHQMTEDVATDLVKGLLESRPKTKRAKLSLCEAKKSEPA